eukprot:13082994-Alexandrium_andersonii.AAC.1
MTLSRGFPDAMTNWLLQSDQTLSCKRKTTSDNSLTTASTHWSMVNARSPSWCRKEVEVLL